MKAMYMEKRVDQNLRTIRGPRAMVNEESD